MNRIGTVAASMLFALASAQAMAEGLTAPRVETDGPLWQARRLVLTTPLPASAFWSGPDTRLRQDGRFTNLLLGDRYFSIPGLTLSQGSLRASTGLLVTGRLSGPALRLGESASQIPRSAPYLGLGYSGLSIKGGWALSADIGVVVDNPAGATRFGSAVLGHQSFDSALREMRLSPLMQLAVSYAF